jgi:hypothetical protein
LTLNETFVAETDWNPATPPTVSKVSTNNTYAGNNTTFSALWNDTHSLSNLCGYIFSTNNTGEWVNYTWVPFTSTPGWGNVTLALNDTIGVTVGFREYANNTLGMWGDSKSYVTKTTSSYLPPSPTPTPAPLQVATPTPAIHPSSKPITTPNALPTITPISTSKPNNTLTTQTILIITAIVTAILFAIFLVSSKKGVIKVRLVNEQDSKSSETESDYQI